MKTSAMKALLAKKRTPSLEQGDIQITVNQDGKETDGVNLGASEPPELTDPTASIANQPEVGEVLDAGNTDENAMLDEQNIEGDAAAADAAVTEGEETLETLETYRLEVRRLIDAQMPVSQATVEALHVGVESAMAKWNISAAEMGIPSVESFTANPIASLEAMEREIVVSQEGIVDSINDFVNKLGNKLQDFIVGVKRNLEKEKGRLATVVQRADALATVKQVPNITNKKIIDNIELAVQDAKNSAAVLANLNSINSGIAGAITNRADDVAKAVDTLIGKVAAAGNTGDGLDGRFADEFRNEITNILFADNNMIKFWVWAKPVTANFFSNWAFLASVAKELMDVVTYKTPALWRSKRPGAAILKEVPALLPRDAKAAAGNTIQAIDAALKHREDYSGTAKKLQAMLDNKFKAAEGDARSQGDKKVGKNLNEVRTMVRIMYDIEYAILKGVRYSVPGTVDYIIESLKLAEQADKAGSAPAAEA